MDYLRAGADATLLHTLSAWRADAANAQELAGADPKAPESIIFADNIVKINRVGSRQQRTIIVTSLAVFNFKPKSYKSWQRRIGLFYLDKLICISGSNELGECYDLTFALFSDGYSRFLWLQCYTCATGLASMTTALTWGVPPSWVRSCRPSSKRSRAC
jgi:hypothetical protein